MLQKLKVWTGVVRDLGLILGMPALVAIGMQLYDLQLGALEEQKAIIEERNKLLQETQYDRALGLIRAQKELFEMEREQLQAQLQEARRDTQQGSAKINDLERQLNELESATKAIGQFRIERNDGGGYRITTPNATIGVRG